MLDFETVAIEVVVLAEVQRRRLATYSAVSLGLLADSLCNHSLIATPKRMSLYQHRVTCAPGFRPVITICMHKWICGKTLLCACVPVGSI